MDINLIALVPFYTVTVTATVVGCGYLLMYFVDVARRQLEK